MDVFLINFSSEMSKSEFELLARLISEDVPPSPLLSPCPLPNDCLLFLSSLPASHQLHIPPHLHTNVPLSRFQPNIQKIYTGKRCFFPLHSISTASLPLGQSLLLFLPRLFLTSLGEGMSFAKLIFQAIKLHFFFDFLILKKLF